jgi:hypothetical protein
MTYLVIFQPKNEEVTIMKINTIEGVATYLQVEVDEIHEALKGRNRWDATDRDDECRYTVIHAEPEEN